MPISPRVARFNKVVTNRTIGRLGPWMPGFGVIHHRGRRSGRPYRTPVNVFRHGEDYVVALTYGSHADWVRNVLSAGGCELETRRRMVHLDDPRLYTDETRSDMPWVVRLILGLTDVTEFLRLRLRLRAPGK